MFSERYREFDNNDVEIIAWYNVYHGQILVTPTVFVTAVTPAVEPAK